MKSTPYKKATEMYIEVIAAESVDEISDEANQIYGLKNMHL
ncbi:hypothetical protein MKZ26_02200 [Sporosarcina sp. FSL K6-6792]